MNELDENNSPLSGLKVIEFGQVASGPFTGMLLADLGADVVKIERPDVGDSMREWPPLLENDNGEVYSGNFASLNRNKRSMTVDIKDEIQLNKFKKLCKKADIIVENFRPGVLRKVGLDYESLSKINPKLVYCSISGYGQTGLYANKGAFDVTVQAISGMMSVTGEEDGSPVKGGVPVADFATALYAAYSILAAILMREKTGKGTNIDCSMIGSMLGISALQTSEYFGTKKPPKRLGSAHPRNAPYQGFQAKDKMFVIAAGNDKLWRKVLNIIEMPDLANDERFVTQQLRAKNQKELEALIQPVFQKQKAAYWLNIFDEEGVPCAPINNFEEALNDPHVMDMGLIGKMNLPNNIQNEYIRYPVSFSDYEFKITNPPPELGQHTEEVYNEWLKD